MSNAVKFTKEGRVSIDVRVAEEKDGVAHVRTSVEDTGIGIDEDKIELLFDQFTQADASTSRRFGGTGLGLSISKQLAELMGGEIGAESQAEIGSTFWFTLPLPVETPEAEQKPSAAESSIGEESPARDESHEGTRILIAEDNFTNQLVAKEILEGMGCAVDLAANGKEALVMVWLLPYDAIFMDCQMPEMDGFEATRTIRRREKADGGRIPIFAMTANAMDDNRERCLEAGMDDFLSKPVTPEKIRNCLDRLTSRDRAG